jgi:hypothetical protein
MSAPIITLAMLKSAGACADQVALCEATFGDSVVVTRETMTLAAEVGIEIALGAFLLLRGPFWGSFYAGIVEPLKVYAAARDEADKAHAAATAEADKTYRAAMAAPFADAFIAQCRAEVAA